ncbi:MAG: hypothetical protein LBF77_09780, partial [Spirochaetaceae bacterium]|nr:hypothetical protein [Spirochaetaceae bacterium]
KPYEYQENWMRIRVIEAKARGVGVAEPAAKLHHIIAHNEVMMKRNVGAGVCAAFGCRAV